MSRFTQDRGIALINALLLLAAMSSVAILLLQRAEQTHSRQRNQHDVAQVKAYLDAMESQIRMVLDADSNQGNFDHFKEDWAQLEFDLPIERGTVRAQLTDLNGRLNLHWLTAEVGFAKPALEYIITDISLPTTLSDRILDWISEGGPSASNASSSVPKIKPRGGAPVIMDELLAITSLTPQIFERIEPYFTSIEAEPSININTASRRLLRGIFQNIAPATIDKLLSERSSKPFEDIDDVTLWFSENTSETEFESLDLSPLVIHSNWFQAQISATLNSTRLTRRVIFERSAETGKTLVVLRYIAKLDQVDER